MPVINLLSLKDTSTFYKAYQEPLHDWLLLLNMLLNRTENCSGVFVIWVKGSYLEAKEALFVDLMNPLPTTENCSEKLNSLTLSCHTIISLVVYGLLADIILDMLERKLLVKEAVLVDPINRFTEHQMRPISSSY